MKGKAIFAGLAAVLLAAAPARAQNAVSRGAYLAVLGDCAGCHNVPNKPAFSGGMPFGLPDILYQRE